MATLARTKTQQGGLVARSAPGLPFLLHEGMEVAFVPPQHAAPRRAYVKSVEDKNNGTYLVYFEGIDSASVAQLLVDCDVLIHREDVPDDTLVWGVRGLAGFTVHDERSGFSGVVDEMLEYPGQMLLLTRRINTDANSTADNGKSVLIPLVDAFVRSLDEDAHHIEVELPNGLVDL